MIQRRPDWWRQVQQWQRVRERGRSRAGTLKEPVVILQAQEKGTVRRSWVESDMLKMRIGLWDL